MSAARAPAIAAILCLAWSVAAAQTSAPRGGRALTPLPDPPRPSRSSGPHPGWLAGPDGPILPPQSFQPRSPFASGAGLDAGACRLAATPPCAREKETYDTDARRKACEAQVSKHVQDVFAFRECLNDEATRATRAVNEAIRLLKCKKPTLKGCD